MLGRRAVRLLTQKISQEVDDELMGSRIGYSTDQLMELAGQAVAVVTFKEFHQRITEKKNAAPSVLVVCGPGNNGGDGLVSARHLRLFGWNPVVLYPKRNKAPLFSNLCLLCERFSIPIFDDVASLPTQISDFDVIVDAIFGFSFKPPIRAPFDSILQDLRAVSVPIVSVDIPSGWDVEHGNVNDLGLHPEVLVSLTAPKVCSQFHQGSHWIGGRFVPQEIDEQFELNLPEYPGCEVVVKVA